MTESPNRTQAEPPPWGDDPAAVYTALEAMVAASRKVQARHARMRADLPGPVYLRDFATIRLAGPRRVGHTEAAIRAARDLFPGRCAYIVPSPHMANAARRRPVDWVVGVPGDAKLRGLGGDIEAAIVDPSSHLSGEQVDSLYEAFGPRAAQGAFFLIFLG